MNTRRDVCVINPVVDFIFAEFCTEFYASNDAGGKRQFGEFWPGILLMLMSTRSTIYAFQWAISGSERLQAMVHGA